MDNDTTTDPVPASYQDIDDWTEAELTIIELIRDGVHFFKPNNRMLLELHPRPILLWKKGMSISDSNLDSEDLSNNDNMDTDNNYGKENSANCSNPLNPNKKIRTEDGFTSPPSRHISRTAETTSNNPRNRVIIGNRFAPLANLPEY